MAQGATGSFRQLDRAFFRQGALPLAKALLGCVLVRLLPGGERLSGRIVEVEAYLGTRDRAAHSFGGRHTPRNHSMYLAGGHAYVYFTYGMHWCMNVVAAGEGEPQACLIRALEPLEGIDRMHRHRSAGRKRKSPLKLHDLCSGPARLTQALGIDRTMDGVPLLGEDSLRLESGPAVPPRRRARAPRIGIDYAGEWAGRLLRFYEKGNPHVSVKA